MGTRWLAFSLAVSAGLFVAGCGSGNTGGADGTGGGGGDGAVMDGASGDGAGGGDGSSSRDGSGGNRDGGSGTGDGGSGSRDGSAAGDGAGGRDGASGGMEVCDNGVDDDGDGMIDEACSCAPGATQQCFGGDPALAGVGQCHWGSQSCTGSGEIGTWGTCAGSGAPAAEACDGADNDCDGQTDEGCQCQPGTQQLCYPGPSGTEGVGACHAGAQLCSDNGSGSSWGPCNGAVVPTAEVCGNAVDDDCNGMVDEGCVCDAGASRPCYNGPAGTADVGVCRSGTQACVSDSSGTHWSPCSGEVDPGTEVCADGVDNDCDGAVDEGCVCPPGATQACYDGPAGTNGVGVCHGGTQSCVMGSSGSSWTACSGEVLPGPEVCGDRVDNDCNGYVDETCTPCITASGTAWQINLGQGPQCTGYTFGSHGEPYEYAWSSIPPESDGGWGPEYDQSISFSDPSTLCGTGCDCLNGVDFTYFQTFFDLPAGFNVTDLRVTINNVDDGVQITVFNAAYPGGVVDPGGYAYLGGGSTTNLAPYIRAGRNRIVLTHVDDCCQVRQIAGVTITLNGGALTQCP